MWHRNHAPSGGATLLVQVQNAHARLRRLRLRAEAQLRRVRGHTQALKRYLCALRAHLRHEAGFFLGTSTPENLALVQLLGVQQAAILQQIDLIEGLLPHGTGYRMELGNAWIMLTLQLEREEIWEESCLAMRWQAIASAKGQDRVGAGQPLSCYADD